MTITIEEALRQPPWKHQPLPASPEGWQARAAEVSAILALDQVARDRAQAVPQAEVQLIKDSGLTLLLGPVAHGGGGQRWETAYRVVREVAAGDGSIGQLLAYHYLWAWAVRLVGTPAQIEAVEALYTGGNLFVGGAVNPRDGDLVINEVDGRLRYNGRKSFSTGSRVSDLTVLEGVLQGTDKHIFAIVPSRQDGIQYHGDWDHLGQRLTESGGVTITDVEVDWSGAAGYVGKVYQSRPYETLNLPAIQQLFTEFYLGIARGALRTAAAYTREKTRPWPYGGGDKASATEEWYILEAYGTLQSRLWAAEALADAAGSELARLLHADRDSVTPQQRGETAVRVAAAKQVAVDVGLEIGTRVFEVTGARATANAVGLDIFWRNIRTHSLHDPVAYKRREVGAYALLGQIPEPSWYT
ncbi:MAG: monooxygenase [Comamonadaceae bacterium]|nr:MAG: monooxygenase [Comamonadaceae bacterium]